MRSGKTHPWTWDAEVAFRGLKRLIIMAVDLFSPNLIGARDGTFPYICWPDACGYGVGAGGFQHAPRPDAELFEPVTTRAQRLSLEGFQKDAKVVKAPPRRKVPALARPPGAPFGPRAGRSSPTGRRQRPPRSTEQPKANKSSAQFMKVVDVAWKLVK